MSSTDKSYEHGVRNAVRGDAFLWNQALSSYIQVQECSTMSPNPVINHLQHIDIKIITKTLQPSSEIRRVQPLYIQIFITLSLPKQQTKMLM